MDACYKEHYFPALTDEGRRMLRFLLEHPHAPIYRNTSGNRLTAEDVKRVQEFEQEVARRAVGWPPDGRPEWLNDFVDRCRKEVPFYRQYENRRDPFEDLPTISRADLSRDIAAFVPDPVRVEELINFQTSGTTGHPLLIPSHPVVAADYLAFHKKAMARFGVQLTNGRGQVGVVLVGCQRKCFTYVSVTPTMDESGLAKINLHPDDWRDPGDRRKYLDALNPEVYTGDPISLAALAELPLETRPRALISTSMALSDGLADRLRSRFGCPVLDLYSMNEAGPIAVSDPAAGGHLLLQPRLYVEILDPAGRRVQHGRRGEVTLTGGFNFCLPLLRYRTGDQASLGYSETGPVLIGLEGRPTVRFRITDGRWLNNIEITHALQHLALPRFAVHQGRDGTLLVRLDRPERFKADIASALVQLFGPGQPMTFQPLEREDKVIQYTSEIGEES